MATDFADIRMVALEEERTIRADPAQPLYDVHFVLSAVAPVGWCQIVQTHLSPRGVAGRRAWPQSKYIVVRCAIDEIERVLSELRPVLEAANREYRAWSAACERTRQVAEDFDRKELEKLRGLKARLVFD
ncbi:MAG TPA: hypothetical protein VLM40_13060 [Gemmata sp.]|nr:hypothetical protein [Gemmata sp.]